MPTSAVELADRLGLTFDDPALFGGALVHSSYVNEHLEEAIESNERLEFLGDAVLSLVVSAVLFKRHPDESEGVLTTRRAAIVSTGGLARIARRLGIGDALVLGQGAEHSGERARSSVLAGLFEAIVAAIYLDRGLADVQAFVLRAAGPEIEAAVPADALKAPKSRLQELAFARTGRAPAYRIVSSEGPDHDRHFVVQVSVDGSVLGEGEGRNRREAETMAAVVALEMLEQPGAGEGAGALGPVGSPSPRDGWREPGTPPRAASRRFQVLRGADRRGARARHLRRRGPQWQRQVQPRRRPALGARRAGPGAAQQARRGPHLRRQREPARRGHG